ncbi:MAG TPA: histidine kinase [Streptosporangiaceae bacterium]|nr:histidine kinase [Streptosporangiaceae bacterium]
MRKLLLWAATRLGPYALLIYGGCGLYLARKYSHGWTGSTVYGVVVVPHEAGHSNWILPQAVVFLAIGGWLVRRWRLPGSELVPATARWLWASRTRGIPRGQEFLILLLAPVAIALTAQWVDSGRVAAITFLEVGGLVLALRARLWAATVAAAGLIVLGGYGLLLAMFWPQIPSGSRYGLVQMGSHTFLGCGIEGTALLALGVWLAPRVLGMHTGAYTAALEARAVELTERVGALTQTRTDAIDTAAAELRRIERDLHDGAQARLVALGLSLQAAERVFRRNPEAALALVSEAKEASSLALTELRDLVRGIYPPVLADRGLADAIRALALDAPVHTTTDVDLPGEVDMPVGAAVYFAFAEVLTNAIRHSGARTIKTLLTYERGVLRVQVTDDGCGGADPVNGTGLTGIERRLATFDGILAVSSPPGGPTIVVIEVPCALSSPKTSTC